MYNVLIYYFVYPILAPSIIFLSNSCAVLTSLETTKAIGQDEVNMNGIYIKFGCTKVKQEKGIST